MAPPHPRVVNAFHAMRDLGITEEKVKPVLKRLLKLYDKNWEPIEDDHYRVLIEAIFESEEPQAPISSKKRENSEAPIASKKKELEQTLEQEEMLQEETEPPLKRHHSAFQDQAAHVDENFTLSAGGSQAIPCDKPIDDYPESFPPAVIYPEKPNENGGERFLQEENGAGPSVIKTTIDADHAFKSLPGKNTEDSNSSYEFSSELVAASSPGGEVKMFLNCNVSQVSASFRMPALDDVLKLVEGRCRERYNIQDPDFSLKKIVEAVGEGVLELGSEP